MHYRIVHSPLQRLLVLFLAVLLAACGSGQPSPTPTTGPPTAAPTTPATAAPTAAPTEAEISGPAYDNPVYPQDFPDPHILRVQDTYYGYATNAFGSNIQLIRSEDLITWERLGDALPVLPDWAALNFGYTWAPGVIQIGDTFLLYYTVRVQEADRQCISLATSATPEGPFTDDSSEPFICQLDLGGSIDPYPYQDPDGQLYLFWKNDGNCCGMDVFLWVQPLSPDGLSLVGEPVQLIKRDQPWEIPLIENPAMVKNGEGYYLFYSGNWWESLDYAVGYAVCETVTGPCEKPLDEPIFTYTPETMGPGGQSFFTDEAGNLWMAYHAWTGADVGYPAGERSLRIDPVEFVAGEPVIEGPTDDPQPLP
jgi:beta-xylosidase